MPLEEVKTIVESWASRRHLLAGIGASDDLTRFVEAHNELTRKLVSEFQNQNVEFWSALAELATNAQTQVTKGAKLFANKKDRTSL